MSGRPPEKGTPTVVPAVLAATLLVMVLATWAAAIGPDRVFGSDPHPRDTPGERSDDPPPPTGDDDLGEEDDDPRGDGWGSTAIFVVQTLVVLTGLYLVVLLARWVRSELTADHFRRRRRKVEFEVLPPSPEQAAESITSDADRQLSLLREGSPRNGIVACWHRFEVQAEGAGLGREPWETSAEFTLRMLDLVSADEHAVEELAVLYREARFSDHELGEAARDAAVDALRRIHLSLGVRAGGPA